MWPSEVYLNAELNQLGHHHCQCNNSKLYLYSRMNWRQGEPTSTTTTTIRLQLHFATLQNYMLSIQLANEWTVAPRRLWMRPLKRRRPNPKYLSFATLCVNWSKSQSTPYSSSVLNAIRIASERPSYLPQAIAIVTWCRGYLSNYIGAWRRVCESWSTRQGGGALTRGDDGYVSSGAVAWRRRRGWIHNSPPSVRWPLFSRIQLLLLLRQRRPIRPLIKHFHTQIYILYIHPPFYLCSTI